MKQDNIITLIEEAIMECIENRDFVLFTSFLKSPYLDIFKTVISHQISFYKEIGVPFNKIIQKKSEKIIFDIVKAGQDAEIPPHVLESMIINNTESYIDWDSQPEIEQKYSQMAGC